MIVSTFRGRFDEYDATLNVGEDGTLALTGAAPVNSLAVKDENLAARLSGPEFFDVENHPTKFGLNWNAPPPKGGVALPNDVKLTTDLEFTKQA